MKLAHFYSGKRILITGGAGYLAARIVRSLKDVDCQIARLDLPGTVFPPVRGTARIHDFGEDIRDGSVWRNVLDNIDVVFHFASQTSAAKANNDPAADHAINVMPMLHLLETCRMKSWHPVVLFSGTVTEMGIPATVPVDETAPDNPITMYDLHKWMAEQYLQYYAGNGHVFGATLRLPNIYGPGPTCGSADRGILNAMILKALKGEALTVYGTGKYMRDYLYVDDAAEAFVAAGAQIESLNGHHFVIGSGQGCPLVEAFRLIADRVAQRTGHRVPVTHVEPPLPQSPIEERNFVANASKFSGATGWRAHHSLRDGIDLTIDAVLKSTDIVPEV